MITPHIVVFKSWREYVDTAENGKTDMRAGRASQNPDKEWTGVATPQEAYKLAREGWNEGTKAIKDMATPLFNHVSKMIERVEVSHDTEGHAIDVARFVDGEPEAWLKFENVIQESESGHKLVRIAFNMSASSMVDTDVIRRKGAAVAALVELLEYAGHRVELVLCHAVGQRRDGDAYAETYIRLKDFDQNLDNGVLAFALAHPATLRCLEFSISEQMPGDVRSLIGVPGNYGVPADIQTANQGDIYIGKSHGHDSQWSTADGAEKWVIDQLKKQGISLNLAVK